MFGPTRAKLIAQVAQCTLGAWAEALKRATATKADAPDPEDYLSLLQEDLVLSIGDGRLALASMLDTPVSHSRCRG